MSLSTLNKYNLKLMVKFHFKLFHIKHYHKVSAPIKFIFVVVSVEVSGKVIYASVERLHRKLLYALEKRPN